MNWAVHMIWSLAECHGKRGWNQMKRQTLCGMVLLAIAAILVSCGGNAREQAVSSGVQSAVTSAPSVKTNLVVALDGEPQQLDPYAHSNQNGFVVSRLVFESLMKTDDEGNVIPWLATAWNMVDDTTLQLTLRDDVFFHDGSKLTSEDVAYSLALAAKSSFTSNLFGSIDTEGFEIPDATHLVVKLKFPNAALIPAMASYRCAIVSKNYYETATDEQRSRHPMGTGPMRFKNWVSGDRIELESSDSYWGEPLPYKDFTARVIIEGSSRAIELETGGVDIAFNLPDTEWDRIAGNPKTRLISGNTQGVSFVTFNSSIAPYDNPDVRRGLAYALNRDALVQVGWGGKADVADSFYAPTIFGHKSEHLPGYDPQKAKEYLSKAGYNESNPLHLVYTTYDSTLNRNFSEAVQAMWTAVGVQCEINFVDLAMYTTMNNAGKIQVSLMTNTAVINDPTAALLAWPTSRTISIRHNDAKVDEYLNAGRSTYDQTERASIYGELQDYLADKLYTFPIAFPQNAYGSTSQIANLPFYPNVVPDLSRITFTK